MPTKRKTTKKPVKRKATKRKTARKPTKRRSSGKKKSKTRIIHGETTVTVITERPATHAEIQKHFR